MFRTGPRFKLNEALRPKEEETPALHDLLNTLVDTDEFEAHAEALRKLSK